MRTECAVLCDAASVREGLLSILGAGITHVSFATFPAPLPLTLALRVVLEQREQQTRHKAAVEIHDAQSDAKIAKVETTFVVAHESDEPEAPLASAISLMGVVVGKPGLYLATVTVDQTVVATLPIHAVRTSK